MQHLNKFIVVLTICGSFLASSAVYADTVRSVAPSGVAPSSSPFPGTEQFDADFEAMKQRAVSRNKQHNELSDEDKDTIKRAKEGAYGKDKAGNARKYGQKKDRIREHRRKVKAKARARAIAIARARAEAKYKSSVKGGNRKDRIQSRNTNRPHSPHRSY